MDGFYKKTFTISKSNSNSCNSHHIPRICRYHGYSYMEYGSRSPLWHDFLDIRIYDSISGFDNILHYDKGQIRSHRNISSICTFDKIRSSGSFFLRHSRRNPRINAASLRSSRNRRYCKITWFTNSNSLFTHSISRNWSFDNLLPNSPSREVELA